MGRVRIETIFRPLLLCFLAVAATACMPKVEEDEVIPTVVIKSHAINGNRATEMRIALTGSCPVSTYIMRVFVNNSEYSVGQSSLAIVENSGVPVGTCANGVLSIDYPVPNPMVKRTITFKVKARLNDGRSSLDWAIRSVNYAPPVPELSGFAILSVGGISSGSTLTMYGAGGEAYGGVGDEADAPGNILTSALATLRTGLFGLFQLE